MREFLPGHQGTGKKKSLSSADFAGYLRAKMPPEGLGCSIIIFLTGLVVSPLRTIESECCTESSRSFLPPQRFFPHRRRRERGSREKLSWRGEKETEGGKRKTERIERHTELWTYLRKEKRKGERKKGGELERQRIRKREKQRERRKQKRN